MKHKRIINEFYSVCTMNDKVMCCEYEDGDIDIEHEYHMIDNTRCEFIQHCNRDRNGDYYTTKKIIELSPIGLQNWKEDVIRHEKRSKSYE